MLRRPFLSFVPHNKGAVGIVFALAILPVLGAMGVAVDYSRASEARGQLRAAADAAALAAAQNASVPWGQRKKLAHDIFMANMLANTNIQKINVSINQIEGGVRVEADGVLKNMLLASIGTNTSQVKVTSEAMTTNTATPAGKPVEIALVLDNTGSMRNDMLALKDAARDFTETVFNSNPPGSIKIGIVPFVAAVNPGRNNLSMSYMDTEVKQDSHARYLRNAPIGDFSSCSSTWDGTAGKKSTSGGKRGFLLEKLQKFAVINLELFGIKQAHAQTQVTPSTSKPYSGSWYSPPLSLAPAGTQGFVPTGFQAKDCNLKTPTIISHFDLFSRIPGAQWKGCVEARPEPYDVSDDTPSRSNPDTLFVPYFSPDDPGARGSKVYNDPWGGKGSFTNSYMDDVDLPSGWINGGRWGEHANIFKYDGVNTAQIMETAPTTMGPNRACPDEVMPLTDNRSALLSKISSLNYWEGGGTATPEGLMWGWRVLSPTPPFTEGADYGKTEKIIVLMSDGENLIDSAEEPNYVEYNIYNWYNTDGGNIQDIFTEFMNKRQELACKNIKSKGIKIMTVLFREPNVQAKNLMAACASEPKYFFYAKNAKELKEAFKSMAGEIKGAGSQLRISR